MAGAAALAAGAALRSGAGYVRVAAPGAIATELSILAPCSVLHLCGGPDREHLLPQDHAGLRALAGTVEALAIGPGLGREPGTAGLLAALFQEGFPPGQEKGFPPPGPGCRRPECFCRAEPAS